MFRSYSDDSFNDKHIFIIYEKLLDFENTRLVYLYKFLQSWFFPHKNLQPFVSCISFSYLYIS